MAHPPSQPHPQERRLVSRIAGARNSAIPDPVRCPAWDADPRFRIGAYLTDGTDLFEVMGLSRGRGQIGSVARRVILEDCYTLRKVEFLLDKVRRRFRLVRESAQ
ncbi:MAG TPA: hypothetical protein VKR21_02915 [Solirubrobacteraceae bacterium]|nr:hypothetical protein [Solirubrobacteraceae bacterium]